MNSLYTLSAQHIVQPSNAGTKGAKGEFSPKHRAAEKRRIVLAWLYKWGWCSDPVFHRLLGVGRKPSLRLRERNIIQKVAVPKHMNNSKAFFILHDSVLFEAMRTYEKHDPVAAPLSYPWLRNPPPIHRMGDHHEICQLIALEEINRSPGVLASDRELRAVEQGGAHPDFLIRRGQEAQWHEIELHPKNMDALYFQLGIRNEARKEGRFSEIVWWCGSENVAKNIIRALRLPVIPVINRRQDGKLSRSTTEEGWNPRKLLDITRFEIIDTERGSFNPSLVDTTGFREDPEDEEEVLRGL